MSQAQITQGGARGGAVLTAVDGQLIELKWTAEEVCSIYHVPPDKIVLSAGVLEQIKSFRRVSIA